MQPRSEAENDADRIMVWLYNCPSDSANQYRSGCEMAVIDELYRLHKLRDEKLCYHLEAAIGDNYFEEVLWSMQTF